MRVAILAGGLGTRLSEETEHKPKPMVEIGGRPILWHIMKHYSHYGFREFVILLGYKGYYVKEYFRNLLLHQDDILIETEKNSVTFLGQRPQEDWKVYLVDTGAETMTGGRILRARRYLDSGDFMLTYGDGVSNVELDKLLEFHKRKNKTVTMTSVQPDGRFGSFEQDDEGNVKSFLEKPKGDGSWVNGGFFVCKQEIFEYIENDQTVLEKAPLSTLAQKGQLVTYQHQGFWKCMDTLRDKVELNQLWQAPACPWKMWA